MPRSFADRPPIEPGDIGVERADIDLGHRHRCAVGSILCVEEAEPRAHAMRERAPPRRLRFISLMVPEGEGQLGCHDRPAAVDGEVEALYKRAARIEKVHGQVAWLAEQPLRQLGEPIILAPPLHEPSSS